MKITFELGDVSQVVSVLTVPHVGDTVEIQSWPSGEEQHPYRVAAVHHLLAAGEQIIHVELAPG